MIHINPNTKELLALWEAAEEEAAADGSTPNYLDVYQIFREIAGGWEAHLYNDIAPINAQGKFTGDDNAFIRFTKEDEEDIFVFVYTGEDPYYHVLTTNHNHKIYSSQLPEAVGR
jgi:hypothetical protein